MADTTIAHVDRDFVEWHGGIERYAAWVILIQEPSWLDWFAEARDLVADLLLPGYERQPHVTVLAAGLLAPNHLSEVAINDQAAAIERTLSVQATLHAVGLGASRSCPFIEVRDDAPVIPDLRSRLDEVHVEDSPQNSYPERAPDSSRDLPTGKLASPADITPPHITLGLFRGSGSFEVVRRRLARVRQPDLPTLRVNTLHLCSYDTRYVQGPLRVERETTWNRT